MSVAVGARGLPGEGGAGREDQTGKRGEGGTGPPARAPPRRGQLEGRAALEEDRRDLIARADVLVDHRPGEGKVRALEQMENAGHQNTRTRRPRPTSPAISSRVTGTTRWCSAFQVGSVGTPPASMWKGTPSALRFARNRAMSSPSTSSSVSSARSSTAGPRSTKTTSFSPATIPRPMRIASFARCEARGSSEIRTTTGRLSTTGSVERDESVRAVDEGGQHEQTAVRDRIGVAQRDAALLAAVGADEQLRAARRQHVNSRIVQRADAVVDEVEVQLDAVVEGGVRQADRRREVGMLGPGREEHAELLFRRRHHQASVAS